MELTYANSRMLAAFQLISSDLGQQLLISKACRSIRYWLPWGTYTSKRGQYFLSVNCYPLD
ncbi:hypothetical protein, partial [Brevibacillus fortis]|uniref:hypothetical protein n=1 Tax=Brevibacillus fortis TaxID=2126352 RepID=UPI003D252B3C